MMNRKGSLGGFLDNFQFIFILIIVLVGIIGLIYGLAVTGPLVTGSVIDASDSIRDAVANSPENNTDLGNATSTVTSVVSKTMGKMELLVYASFLGLFIGFLVVAYEVKFYPFLSFAWIGLMIIVTLFAIVISNAYTNQSVDGPTAEFYSTWGSTGWIMTYLPHIFASLGLISGILLFTLQSRSPDEEATTGSVNI
jgi:hypothetical protein